MQVDDEKSYLSRQLDASILLTDRIGATPTLCFTVGIGRESLLVRGVPSLPSGCHVELTLMGDRRDSLTIGCVAAGRSGSDQRLAYEGLSFDERVRLEDLVRPHWDGVDLLEGLTTLACLYGPTTLKDWLCMTTLLERIRQRLLHRSETLAYRKG